MRRAYEGFWGWVARPTAGFWALFYAMTAAFCAQFVFRLAQPSQPTAIDALFALSREGFRDGQYWQLITYSLLHAGIWQLLASIFLLYTVAYEVEDQLGLSHLLGLFVLGSVAGGLLWLAAERIETTGHALVGASAGVASVFFGFIAMYPERPFSLLAGLRMKYLGLVIMTVALYFVIFHARSAANLLGGMLVGTFYVKALLHRWKVDLIPGRDRRALPGPAGRTRRAVSRTEFINTKVDPVLEKIAAQGLESLTEEERRILNEAHDRLS